MTQTLITYRIECKQTMAIGACTLISDIVAPSYAEALEELVRMFPNADPMTATTTVLGTYVA